MKTFGELVNEVEKIEFRNEEILKRVELLSLDASLKSKIKIKEILGEKIKNEVVELNDTVIEGDSGELFCINDSLVVRLKQKIILHIMMYIDDEYLHEKLWTILLK